MHLKRLLQLHDPVYQPLLNTQRLVDGRTVYVLNNLVNLIGTVKVYV